jgi:SAM-dependent MidA family methyltransferase
MQGGILREVYVGVEDGELHEAAGPISTEEIELYFREFDIELPERYTTEVNLRIREWLKGIDRFLIEGFILTVDYGYPAWDYYSEDRNRGTLMCYYRHQLSEAPLSHIGDQDMTAHVNFSAVRRWGEELGFRSLGFCGQGVYLISLGIDEEIRRLSAGPDYPFEVARIKKLILPQGLGESHKVMIQYKGPKSPNLKGFNIRNHINKL